LNPILKFPSETGSKISARSNSAEKEHIRKLPFCQDSRLPSTNPNGAPSSTAHQGNGKKKWIVIISAVAGVSAAVLLAGKKTSIDLSSN
jgi:hypothetical protein